MLSRSYRDQSLDHWDMRTGRNGAVTVVLTARESRSLGYAHWPEPAPPWKACRAESRSLGYAHWPELKARVEACAAKSRSLGYAHWPEPVLLINTANTESRSLGYAHWPELTPDDIDFAQ